MIIEIKMPSLSAARYGKDNIRVYKVHKDEKTGVQDVTEMTVCVLLEGEIETSYVAPAWRPLRARLVLRACLLEPPHRDLRS